MQLAINYPSWIHPEIFPGISFLSLFRWYGLMYIFAFGTAFLVFKKQVAEGALNESEKTISEDDMASFFGFCIICLLIGARLFSTLIYESSGMYRSKPWLIFWPFGEDGRFTGLAGMSYHGGFVGGLAGMIIWTVRRKLSVLKWTDAMGISIPLGYTFGRLGNFLNAELFGRITTKPWGMIFPDAQKFSVSLDWVQEFAQKANLSLTEDMVLVNLPRHPSQLYEAFFEGIFLWTIFWFLRKKKPFDGFFTGLYTIGYGFVRFFIEYFREPDIDLGYRISHVSNAPTYLNVSWLNISTGQIFCLFMILGGTGILIASFFLHKKKLK
ncbi:MAG: prolipoprotein diacylglyceryl transferase [Treponemataceae bacterium]